jgi:hypothetical protein
VYQLNLFTRKVFNASRTVIGETPIKRAKSASLGSCSLLLSKPEIIAFSSVLQLVPNELLEQ